MNSISFIEHLQELRKRLIICLVAIGIGFIVSYYFKEKVFEILAKPLIEALPQNHNQHLIYTAPHEAFVIYIKASLLAGLLMASPVIIFEFWCFVAPGLYEHEKRYLYFAIVTSVILFTAGSIFGYFVLLPFGLKFFTSFGTEYIAPFISTKEFFSFAIKILIASGLIFELPVLIFFLAKFGLINANTLRKQRKFAILIIFIVAAIITPPDAFSQIIMAVPMLVLYEISILVARFAVRKNRKEKGRTHE